MDLLGGVVSSDGDGMCDSMDTFFYIQTHVCT